MRDKLLIVAILVGAGIGVWKIAQERQSSRPNITNTEQLISYACDEAIADARKYDGILLDYSVDSIRTVDAVLGRLHNSYKQNPASIRVDGLALEYGAYVGEVIRRHEPGTYWTKDSELGQRSYPLHWGNDEAFPIAWCSKRIINGDEDNIWFKYTALKDGLAKPPKKANVPNPGKPH